MDLTISCAASPKQTESSSCMRQTPRCSVYRVLPDIPGRNIGSAAEWYPAGSTESLYKDSLSESENNPINHMLNQCLSGTGQAQQLFGAIDPLGPKTLSEPPAINGNSVLIILPSFQRCIRQHIPEQMGQNVLQTH